MRQNHRRMLRAAFIFAAALTALCCETQAAAAKKDPAPQTGWVETDGRRSYYLDDGSLAVGTVEIDGIPYVFAPNGFQQLGWQDVSGQRRFYDPETGEPVTGMLHWRGEDYYISPEDGKITGLSDTELGMLYSDSDGVLYHDGWLNDGENWYFADESGVLAEGETDVDGMTCFFGENAELLTGFQTDSEGVTRCYEPVSEPDSEEPVVLHTGWLETDSSTYYFNDAGEMQTGLTGVDGNVYIFGEDGALCQGWQTLDDKIYYCGEDAKIIHGLAEIDGDTYYFASDGTMQTGSCEVGVPMFFDETGKRIDGWHDTENGRIYRSPETGVPYTGWQTIQEKEYYFDADGIMASGMVTLDGKRYRFDEDGAYHPVKICLDAGHFAKCNNSPVNPVYWESDFNWKMHLYLKEELEKYNIVVITTREDKDTDLGLEDRGRCSAGCDLFYSIHSNAIDNYSIDAPVCCCTITGTCDQLGLDIANLVADVMGTYQRGMIWKRHGEKFPDLDYYGVLRGATYVGTPAILLEHSYHTNLRATNWLLVDSNVRRMAVAEAEFLARYFDMIP